MAKASKPRKSGREKLMNPPVDLPKVISVPAKFPGGVKAQASRLTREGHSILAGKGQKPPKVRRFERVLVNRWS